MCLTIPKKIIEVKDSTIIVENPDGSRQEVKSIIKLKSGDFCLTQQNVAIEKIEDGEAKIILDALRRVMK